MRVFTPLAVLHAFGIVRSLAQTFDSTDPVCACDQCCNVLNSTTFTGSLFKSFTYPTVSLDGSYTLIDYGTTTLPSDPGNELAGTPYQHVVRYVKEDGDGRFLYNFQLSSSTGFVNCSNSHVYWRIMESEQVTPTMNYTQGELVKIPMAKSDVGEFCMMDYQGIISMNMLDNPDEVYFAFNDLVDEGETYYIQFNRHPSTLIEPVDSTVKFKYIIRPGSTEVQQVQSGNQFYMEVTFDVQDVEPNVTPDPSCIPLDSLVSGAHAFFGSEDGATRCPIEYAAAPFGDSKVGDGRTYTLRFNQSQYEDCAETITSTETTIDFRTTLRLLSGSIGDGCYYFMPSASSQAINIQVDADVTEDVSEVLTQFSSQIITITPQRCEPLADFIVPQVTLKIVINTTFAVVEGSVVERVTTSIPYIDNEMFPLVPDTAGGSDAYTCTRYTGSDNTEYVDCQYYFTTNKCEKIYTTEDGECALTYNSTRLIKDLVFRETYPGGMYVIRRSPVLNTGLQATTFDLELCAPTGEAVAIDVSDRFPSSLQVRNYYDGVDVDWSNTTQLTFNDKMILRLGVGEAAGTTFDNLELFIKTVAVSMRNPRENNRLINQGTFNVREKERNMVNSWMFFYEDPVFCTFYSPDGGVVEDGDLDPENKCQPFYDPFDNQLVRWNNFNTESLNQTAIDHICQLSGGGVDTRNTDFFMFDPNIWFADNVNAFMEVTLTVSGVIHQCGENQTIPTQRRLEGSGWRLLEETPQILYVSKDITITVGGQNGTTVTIVDGPTKSIWDEHTGLLTGLILVSSLFLLFIIFVGAIRWWGDRDDGYASTRSAIHEF